jgi:hypothetical protein
MTLPYRLSYVKNMVIAEAYFYLFKIKETNDGNI